MVLEDITIGTLSPSPVLLKKKKKKFDFDNTDTEHKIFEGNNMGLGILALFLPSN